MYISLWFWKPYFAIWRCSIWSYLFFLWTWSPLYNKQKFEQFKIKTLFILGGGSLKNWFPVKKEQITSLVICTIVSKYIPNNSKFRTQQADWSLRRLLLTWLSFSFHLNFSTQFLFLLLRGKYKQLRVCPQFVKLNLTNCSFQNKFKIHKRCTKL